MHFVVFRLLIKKEFINKFKIQTMIIQVKNQTQKRRVNDWIKRKEHLITKKNHVEMVNVKNVFLLGILIYRKITVLKHGM